MHVPDRGRRRARVKKISLLGKGACREADEWCSSGTRGAAHQHALMNADLSRRTNLRRGLLIRSSTNLGTKGTGR